MKSKEDVATIQDIPEEPPLLNGELAAFPVELVPLESIHAHPQNYKVHPQAQLSHLAQSIKEHGFYRPIVIAQDGTILAGHGVAAAARMLGLAVVPVRRLPLAPDDPRALKVMAGDNEISNLAEVDDRALAQILRQIKMEEGLGLLGTGFDDRSLAHLIALSGVDGVQVEGGPDQEWGGMPEYHQENNFGALASIKVHFATAADLEAFAALLGQNVNIKTTNIWYPKRVNADLKAISYVNNE